MDSMLDIGHLPVRKAAPGDADLLQRCFEIAGEGMAEHFWSKALKPGQSLDEVAQERMIAKINDPSQHIFVAGDKQGAIVGYDIGDRPEPLDGLPPVVRPLVELENEALGTHYINMLAVLPEARNLGLGRALIARSRAVANGKPLSLIVSDVNAGARRLYRALGLAEVDDAPQVSDGWQAPGERWILMIEQL
jgi:ribosomal protein S18 acetylase RimI-like enzyme